MSYFPRTARLLVALAVVGATLTLPVAAADATEQHPRQAKARKAAQHRAEVARARARVAALQAAHARALARAHALAVAQVKLRLREKKSVPKRASIVFDKNWKNPYRSRITFSAWAKVGKKKWVPIERASWRAGSGVGGAAGKDECHRGSGWAPNGTYSFVQHNRRKAPLINGRVFELQPHACRNGTTRQLMFIHSEQNWDNTQCKNTKGDDGCRWEVPIVNDYRSYGCIKMDPDDLAALTRRFHRYFKAETRYPTSVVKVRVTR
jgi:hypothetical protein